MKSAMPTHSNLIDMAVLMHRVHQNVTDIVAVDSLLEDQEHCSL